MQLNLDMYDEELLKRSSKNRKLEERHEQKGRRTGSNLIRFRWGSRVSGDSGGERGGGLEDDGNSSRKGIINERD